MLQRWDASLFWLINSGAPRPWWDTVAGFLSGPWLWMAVLPFTLLAGLFRWRRELVRASLVALVALAVTDVSCGQLKHFFTRIRPCHQFYGKVHLPDGHCGSVYGFPSNHAANATAMASTFFAAGATMTGIFLLPLVLLVGLSRIYLGTHFPGDVLGGYFFGALMGTATAFLLSSRLWSRRLPFLRRNDLHSSVPASTQLATEK